MDNLMEYFKKYSIKVWKDGFESERNVNMRGPYMKAY